MSVGLPSDEVAEDYKSSLEDLVDTQRAVINNLTIIAKENIEHASAISRVLENHIKSTSPPRKLPALYLLDSIVKNVGTPYTLFLSRSLYHTFMGAYSLVGMPIRQKLDEMLQTWKHPNPGSMDTKPVFPYEVIRPIEENLAKFRQIAFDQQQRQTTAARARPTPQPYPGYRNTPTPPHLNGQFPLPPGQPFPSHHQSHPQIPNGHYQQQTQIYNQAPQYSTPPPALPVAQPPFRMANASQPKPPPIDLPQLHKDIDELIGSAQGDAALNPYDTAVKGRLDALIALKTILHQQYHPPDQLQQVRDQVTQLKSAPRPTSALPIGVQPTYTPSHTQAPSQYQPPPSHAQPAQHPVVQPTVPSPADLQSLMSSRNLADIISNVNKTPTPQPPPIQLNPSFSGQGHATGGVNDLLSSLKRAGMLNAPGGSATQTPPFGTPPLLATSSLNHVLSRDVPLTSASIKTPRRHLISLLYESQPNQCTTCGRRFLATEEGREKKRRHYDWHFRTNQRMNEASKRAQNRSWYVDELEWIKSRDDLEGNPVDSAAESTAKPTPSNSSRQKQKFVMVPSDPNLANQPCPICQERFTASYNDEVCDWVWMDAVQVGSRIFHASCHSEVVKPRSRETTPARTDTPDSVLGKRKAVDELADAGPKMIKA